MVRAGWLVMLGCGVAGAVVAEGVPVFGQRDDVKLVCNALAGPSFSQPTGRFFVDIADGELSGKTVAWDITRVTDASLALGDTDDIPKTGSLSVHDNGDTTKPPASAQPEFAVEWTGGTNGVSYGPRQYALKLFEEPGHKPLVDAAGVQVGCVSELKPDTRDPYDDLGQVFGLAPRVKDMVVTSNWQNHVGLKAMADKDVRITVTSIKGQSLELPVETQAAGDTTNLKDNGALKDGEMSDVIRYQVQPNAGNMVIRTEAQCPLAGSGKAMTSTYMVKVYDAEGKPIVDGAGLQLGGFGRIICDSEDGESAPH